ncbi:hypothetical protein DFJ73DRAFT_820023 [Zopfochytrium polystomum]|nr:hypothetical protein DFJ73DRAFT_820023 [Zopfochytrium polystomum]
MAPPPPLSTTTSTTTTDSSSQPPPTPAEAAAAAVAHVNAAAATSSSSSSSLSSSLPAAADDRALEGDAGTVAAISRLLRAPLHRAIVRTELWLLRGASGERRRRLVVLVYDDESNEACLLILQRSSQHVKSTPTVTVVHVLPVLADFQMELYQSNPVMHADCLKSADFTLLLASRGRELKLFEHSLDPIYPLVEALRRCMLEAHPGTFERRFAWLNYYENRSVEIPVLGGDLGDSSGAPTRPEVETAAVNSNPFISENRTIDGADAKRVKDAWIARQLREKEGAFAEFLDIKIFVGTWNVNGYQPTQSIAAWLDAATEHGDPELLVLGFQELDMSTEAYMFSDKTKENVWSAAIEACLERRATSYLKIASKQLVGMLLLVYASEKSLPLISDITVESVGTGLLGMIGNKGAVACRLRYGDSFLCFVNAHLAADPGMVDRRNADFAEICRRLSFPLLENGLGGEYEKYLKRHPWVASGMDSPGMPGATGRRSGVGVFEADHVFFFGDLNYRIPLPFEDVMDLISKDSMKALFEFDQLNTERRAQRAFMNFSEHEVAKKRVPSWCDRILWFRNPVVKAKKLKEDEWLSSKKYGSCMNVLLSDHKPVYAMFVAKTRSVDPSKLAAVNEEVLRVLDKLENDSLPDLKVDTHAIDFGEAAFLVPIVKSFVVENRGQVIASFRFAPKGIEANATPTWCTVNPMASSLSPGEKMLVYVTVHVRDPSTAASLNFGHTALEDTLIFHTDNGKDHFISLSARWQPSAFGNDLDVLCRLTRPVRTYTVASLRLLWIQNRESGRSNSTETVGAVEGVRSLTDVKAVDAVNSGLIESLEKNLSIPKELWRMVDFIYRYGMDMEDLFVTAGDPDVMEYLRDCLDRGVDFDHDALLVDPEEPPSLDGPMDLAFPSPVPSASSPRGSNVSPILTAETLSQLGTRLDVDLLLRSDRLRRQYHPAGRANSAVTPVDSAVATTAPPSPSPTQAPSRAPRKGRHLSVHSMADTLLTFLSALAEPVVPSSLYFRCVQEGYPTLAAARQVVRVMPRVHGNVLLYMCAFLRELVEGGFALETLAKIFAPVLLRPIGNLSSNGRSSSLPNGGGSNVSPGGSPVKETAGIGYEVRRRMFLMRFLERDV